MSASTARQRWYSRRQIMLDQPVQGTLLTRVTIYWVTCLLATTIASWCWLRVTGDSTVSLLDLCYQQSPAWIGSLLLLPLVWADTLRLSSRFVGPIANLRNALKRLEWGDDVPALRSRRGDHWEDLIECFNRLLNRCRR